MKPYCLLGVQWLQMTSAKYQLFKLFEEGTFI